MAPRVSSKGTETQPCESDLLKSHRSHSARGKSKDINDSSEDDGGRKIIMREERVFHYVKLYCYCQRELVNLI